MACVGVVEWRHLRPRCGTQVTPGQVSCSEKAHSGTGLRPGGSKCLAAMQAAARNVQGAGASAGAGFTGTFSVWYNIDQRLGAMKGYSVYNSQPLPQYLRPGIFAEALPVKWQPSPDEQALLSGHEALGAVNDSIKQKGDYTRFARMKRGNLFSGN
ncbi:hypothetical protein ACWREX_003937 [Salmonella enterica]